MATPKTTAASPSAREAAPCEGATEDLERAWHRSHGQQMSVCYALREMLDITKNPEMDLATAYPVAEVLFDLMEQAESAGRAFVDALRQQAASKVRHA